MIWCFKICQSVVKWMLCTCDWCPGIHVVLESCTINKGYKVHVIEQLKKHFKREQIRFHNPVSMIGAKIPLRSLGFSFTFRMFDLVHLLFGWKSSDFFCPLTIMSLKIEFCHINCYFKIYRYIWCEILLSICIEILPKPVETRDTSCWRLSCSLD